MNETPEWVKPMKILCWVLEIVSMALFMLLAYHIYENKSLASYKSIGLIVLWVLSSGMNYGLGMIKIIEESSKG